jgi:hypothetical protein
MVDKGFMRQPLRVQPARRGNATSIDDYLDTPGVQRIAIALDKDGPMTFREFVHASTFDDRLAMKVRDAMASWGLIVVGWKDKKTQLIELRPLGKKFVNLTYKQAEIIAEGGGGAESSDSSSKF